jgi:hypothetical protein
MVADGVTMSVYMPDLNRAHLAVFELRTSAESQSAAMRRFRGTSWTGLHHTPLSTLHPWRVK